MNLPLTLFTSIQSDFKRRILLRASVLGGIGALLLVGGGAFIPPAQLALWGVPLVLLAIILIAGGMVPYRRLCKLELSPDRLEVTDVLLLFRKERLALTIPFEAIESLSFVQTSSYYGVRIGLKPHPAQKLRIHLPLGNAALRRGGGKKGEIHWDLFLPFFSRESVLQLQTRLQNVVHFDEPHDVT
jgi:hypothetical protein